MKYALVDTSNIVVNIINYDGQADYTPPAGSAVQLVNNWVNIGQAIDTPLPTPSTDDLLNALADYRYKKEVGGVMVAGSLVSTDRDTQGKLTAARILAKESTSDNPYTVKWKVAQGVFATLSASQVISLADAVAIWVQKCFTAEATVTAAIGQYTTLAQVTAAFDVAVGG